MALSDMLGLLGGGGSDPLDIYGDLFTPQQKAALQQRSASEGLLKLAGAFGAAAQPSRMPTSFMATLGQAAGAMAGSGDDATKIALEAMKTGEAVRVSKQKRELIAKATPIVQALIAAGIDPNSPVGQQALAAAGVPAGAAAGAASGALQPSGAPPVPGTGGPNAPPPPPGAPPGMTTSATAADAPVPLGAPPPRGAPQQNTGLLPPGPLDQVLGPDGQPLPGSGVLPTMAASYGGAPGGMPPFSRASSTTPTGSAPPGAAGADEWLRQNAPFPVQGRARPPGAYAQGFTYDEPKVPFGQDPGDFLPGRGATPGAGGPRSQAIEYFTKQGWTREQAAGIAANLEAESSWRKDVPGDGGRAFGYAQWHPPRQENFKRVFGKDIRNATEEEQLAFVNWELNNTEKAAGDRLRNAASPRDAAAIVSKYYERPADVEGNAARRGSLAEKINGGGQDVVIPSGRGVPASALRNVADTGAVPGMPSTPGGGYIPGLGITPQGLGALNALLEMGGVDSPFKSVLDTYYRSPAYLGEAATAETTARKKVEEEFAPRIKEAETLADLRAQQQLRPELERRIAEAKIDPNLKEHERKAIIDRETEKLKQLQAGMLSSREVVVTPPGGQPRKMTLTNEQILRLNSGKGLLELDLSPMSGLQLGEPVLSPGETVTQQKSAELPYTTKDMEITWPDGETRKVTVTGEQAKDIAEGRPVPAIGWPGSAAGGAAVPADDRPRGGAAVYPPGHAEATTVMLKERRPKAEAAVQSLQFNETAKRLLDAGIISGYGAGLRLDAAKAKSLLGWDDARIANTEAFLATQTRQVASALASGAFGSGSSITEEDRRQAANMVGQNAALDEKSLRFLVNLNDAAANWEIDRYNNDVQKHDPKGRLPILRVDRPPKQEAKPSANQPTPVGSAKIGDKPYTKWSDGKWRPVGELPGEEK